MNRSKYAQTCLALAILTFGVLAPAASCFAQLDSAQLSTAQPNSAQPYVGNPIAGELLVANRQLGLCLLCHQAPIASERFQGNIGPNLAGVGSRLSKGELTQRIVDSRVVNPQSIMPAYFRSTQLHRVSAAQVGRTLFTAQQVDDVVAYLVTLK